MPTSKGIKSIRRRNCHVISRTYFNPIAQNLIWYSLVKVVQLDMEIPFYTAVLDIVTFECMFASILIWQGRKIEENSKLSCFYGQSLRWCIFVCKTNFYKSWRYRLRTTAGFVIGEYHLSTGSSNPHSAGYVRIATYAHAIHYFQDGVEDWPFSFLQLFSALFEFSIMDFYTRVEFLETCPTLIELDYLDTWVFQCMLMDHKLWPESKTFSDQNISILL